MSEDQHSAAPPGNAWEEWTSVKAALDKVKGLPVDFLVEQRHCQMTGYIADLGAIGS